MCIIWQNIQNFNTFCNILYITNRGFVFSIMPWRIRMFYFINYILKSMNLHRNPQCITVWNWIPLYKYQYWILFFFFFWKMEQNVRDFWGKFHVNKKLYKWKNVCCFFQCTFVSLFFFFIWIGGNKNLYVIWNLSNCKCFFRFN